MADQVKVPTRYTPDNAGAVWRTLGDRGDTYFTLEIGDYALVYFEIDADLARGLNTTPYLEFEYACGTRVYHYRADTAYGVASRVLGWLDVNFGYDLTNIVVNSTIITRGVDAVLLLPQFRSVRPLKTAFTILLTTVFDRQYRHSSWMDIVRHQAYSHVVRELGATSGHSIPEVNGALSASINHIDQQLRSGAG